MAIKHLHHLFVERQFPLDSAHPIQLLQQLEPHGTELRRAQKLDSP